MKDLCLTGGLSRAQVNYIYSLRLFGDLHATRAHSSLLARGLRGDLAKGKALTYVEVVRGPSES